MYLANKYTKWYTQIISHARSRILPDDFYTETHHIIPKSLGGKNTKDNLVALTAREHFICHLLLTKMVPLGDSRNKIVYAAWCMANLENNNQIRYKCSSRLYAALREHFTSLHSDRLKKNNPMSDPLIRDKHKESIKQRGKTIGNSGRIASAETRAKMRSARAKQVITEETKRKLSELNKGKPGRIFTEEEKARVSEGLRRSWARRKALKDTLD